ncbi:MAG: acyl-CoA thioesterase [Lachnospiraceae bacterium]|nr:acyl-CoA thioesterase [Lachnospiraceae bacterium]
MEKRTVEYSKTEQVHLVQPAHLNGGNRLFGGTLLNWIDEVAAIVAMRHAGVKTVTTAAIDQLEFKAGAYINDLIVLIGYVVYTGRTSMEVRVDTYVESTDGMRRVINRANIILVALDEHDTPTAIPQLELQNDIQREQYLQAKQRRELRFTQEQELLK